MVILFSRSNEKYSKTISAFIKTALQFDKADFNEKEENIKQNG